MLITLFEIPTRQKAAEWPLGLHSLFATALQPPSSCLDAPIRACREVVCTLPDGPNLACPEVAYTLAGGPELQGMTGLQKMAGSSRPTCHF